MEAYLPVLVLLLTLLLGIPIAVSLAVSGMVGIYVVTGDLNRLMGILSMAPYSSIAEMRRPGASEGLAAGAVRIGATLNILIPPSIAMVIYGIATQTSIGKLLIAGVIPGILLGIVLSITVYLWV